MFNEETLREEIAKTWGDHGEHMEVYDMLLSKRAKPKTFDQVMERKLQQPEPLVFEITLPKDCTEARFLSRNMMNPKPLTIKNCWVIERGDSIGKQKQVFDLQAQSIEEQSEENNPTNTDYPIYFHKIIDIEDNKLKMDLTKSIDLEKDNLLVITFGDRCRIELGPDGVNFEIDKKNSIWETNHRDKILVELDMNESEEEDDESK